MKDNPILSPDGKQVLIDGEWRVLDQQNVSLTDSVIVGDVSLTSTVNINSRSKSDEISNLLDLALLKLSKGDMAAVKTIYLEAKKIDVLLAQDFFENIHATEIGTLFVDIAEHHLVKIIRTEVNLETTYRNGDFNFITNVNGADELIVARANLQIAADNAEMFLGNLLQVIERCVLEDESAENILGLDKLKQLYRLAIILRIACNQILIKTNEAEVLIDKSVLGKRIENLRVESLNMRTTGKMLCTKFSLLEGINVAQFNQISVWKNEFSDLVDILENLTEEDTLEDFERIQNVNRLNNSQGCFIATAAYGTPFAEDIDVLRMWRDFTLKQSISGRIFIKTYYTFSPPVAWIISKSKFLRTLTRSLLKPLIKLIAKNSHVEFQLWKQNRTS